MATRTIDITPDVSLLRKAGEVNYKIPQAVAELIDNAIDERVAGEKVNIEVKIGYGKVRFLEVIDNAGGMTPEQAAAAMVMAKSSKKGGVIGEFGMGMKTACSNLGAHFEIITCTADAKKACRIEYDEAQFLKDGKWELKLEEVAKPFDHGTQIRITEPKTNLYAGVKDTLLRNFGKTFKHFVGSGEIEIVVNGDVVEPYIPDTIRDYDTTITFDINGKVVNGWASLAKQGTSKGAYGFDLIRSNRVVKEHAKVGFRPAAALTRLIGELHLDSFPVTNNKTDFRVDTEEWESLEAQLREQLVDLIRAARKMANPGKLAAKDEAEVAEHIANVKDTLKSPDLQEDLDRRALDSDLADDFTEGPVPFATPVGDTDEGEPTSASPSRRSGEETTTTERRTDGSTLNQHRLNRVKTQLRNLNIEHQVMRLGKDTAYKIWDIDGVGNRKKLVVTTNIDHPFYAVMEPAGGFMLWIKHNIVEAVAEYFTNETARTENMLLVKSDILKHIGKMRIDMVEEAEEETSIGG